MHKLLYIGFVLLLSLSALNQLTGLVKIKSLDGFVLEKETKSPTFSISDYLSVQWQDSISNYISKRTNSRPAFIRFRNTIDYELFDIVHVHNVFKGKNNYLFYASDYYMKGLDSKPLSEMEKNTEKLKHIQDSLNSIGKHVVYAITPEKMFVFPEFLPSYYSLNNKVRFTYDNYIKLFNEKQLEYIDFNKWFIELKRDAPYALFAKGGKHWTYYYAATAADSIGDFLRKKECRVSDFDSISTIENGNVWREDIDTWSAANLVFSYEKENIPTVNYAIREKENDDVIVLADSYFHVIAWSHIFKKQYGENSEFWYYNKMRNDVNNNPLGSPSKKVFLEKDVKAYIILISVGNLSNFDFGFIDYFN